MVTREILKKELVSLEQRINKKFESLELRMDAKIDSAGLSFKEYVDSRIAPMQGGIGDLKRDIQVLKTGMDTRFNKLEGYFEQLVGLFNVSGKKLDDHESRIKILESN